MRIEFPSMRGYVLDALEALGRRERQEQWGRHDEQRDSYDDLTLNVHLLYDDTQVLPDPAAAVGTVLWPEDVEPMRQLGAVLGPLLDDLGDASDATYISDSRWNAVVDAASSALVELRRRPSE